MENLRLECPFDFSLLIDLLLKNSKYNLPAVTIEKIRVFGEECFKAGFEAGKLPINNHKYKVR